jgi:hypothetical protein
MHDVTVVTVYITQEMYQTFFPANPNLNARKLVGIDNRQLNRGLPAIYNEVIQDFKDHNCWLFFLHEDFEIKGSLEGIDDLDKSCVYGTFGIHLDGDVPVAYGRHTCSDKDGSNAVEVGITADTPADVQTLDCQTILVHTSLLAEFPGLRFDEKLTFDLYVEDFCIHARERHGIEAKVFPLEFQHYSHGNITKRYHEGLRYLAEKYPDVAVPGSCSFIGGRAGDLEKYFTYAIRANRSNAGIVRVLRRLSGYAKRLRSRVADW